MFNKIRFFLLRNTTIRQKIAKNAFWLFFGQIASRLLKVVIVIYSARILGAEGYGLFSFALSAVMLLSLFSDIGIGPLLVRELVKLKSIRPERGSKTLVSLPPEDRALRDEQYYYQYFSTSFYLKLALFVFIAIAAIAASFFIPHKNAVPIIYIFLVMIFFDILRSVFNSFTESLEKMEIEAMGNIANAFFTTTAGLILLKIYSFPISLAAAYSIGSMISAIIVIVGLKPYFRFRQLFNNFNADLAKTILKLAWPMAIGALIGSVMIYVDTLMLGWFKSTKEVGIYSAAIKIPQLLIVPIGLLGTAALPALSRFFQDKEKFSNLVKQIIQISMYLAFPFIIGGVLLAKPIIALIFGQEYIAAYPIFQIILPMIFAVYATHILNLGLFIHNLQKKTMLLAAAAALFDIILNYIFIPIYGYWGAAISTVFSEYCAFILILIFFVKTLGFSPIVKEIKKPLLAAVIMGLFLLIPQINHFSIFIIIPISSLIYILALYLLKADIFKQIKLIFSFD